MGNRKEGNASEFTILSKSGIGNFYPPTIGWDVGKTGVKQSIEATFISDRGLPRLDKIVVQNGQNILNGQVNQNIFEFQFTVNRKTKPDTNNTVGSKKNVKFTQNAHI